jgi:2-polyprenyl-3-methyl-5-hydroxy-6-metoxy-1,4-benzoquinol methylase
VNSSTEASSPTSAGARSPLLLRLPDEPSLRQMFHRRYGPSDKLGWGPRQRQQCGYHTPDDVYEALVAGLVVPGVAWLDVGCGRELFPNNLGLAEALSRRCARLTGVDPDPTLMENPWVHEKIAGGIDDYDGGAAFDLVTMRMVAEHIDDPMACTKAIARALRLRQVRFGHVAADE